MQYNGEANNIDITTLADKHAGTTDTSFPLAEKALYANLALRTIRSWIMQAYGGWMIDDSNNSDEPIITGSLVKDQQMYFFATAAMTRSGGGTPEVQDIFGVDFKDQGGSWNKLDPITLEQIRDMGYSETEFQKISGFPIYYRPTADGFKVYPAWSGTTAAASIRAHISDKVVAFVPGDTTAKPGFDSNFHEALSCGMALLFCKNNNRDKRITTLQKDWDGNEDSTNREGGWKLRIKDHYKTKFRENTPPTMRRRSDFVGQYA